MPDALADVPTIKCEEFQEFRRQLAADTIQIVFSSYYIGNPVSVFGHTFLKFKRGPESGGVRSELFDTTMNYAAQPGDVGLISYVFKGLTGGFHGSFSMGPYHLKVREYNNFEQRDLWLYDLHLSRDEIDRFVAHAWELRDVQADYEFHRRNCAYFVLAVIDAAAPRLTLSDRFTLRTVPVDTLRAVASVPGLLSNPVYRPSSQSQFVWLYAHADKVAREEFRKLVNSDPGTLASLNPSDESLDLSLSYLEWRHPDRGLPTNQPLPIEILRQRTLLAITMERSRSEDALARPEEDSPHHGHPSARIAVGGGASSRAGSFIDLEGRVVLHDFDDPPSGYPAGMALSMGHLGARILPESDAYPRLWKADLFQATVLNRWSLDWLTPSWKGGLGIHRIYDGRCGGCLAAEADIAIGMSYWWRHLGWGGGLFLLPSTILSYSPSFRTHSFEPAVGPVIGLIVDLPTNGALQFEARRLWFPGRSGIGPTISGSLAQSLGEVWSISLEASAGRRIGESGISLRRYF